MDSILPKISVILPVYNLENYLADCLISVIEQDYQNIEIVLVDDGSKDSSREIAENLLATSGREHKIISRPNKGVSATRNDGIKAATGEWIIMVDADDIIVKTMLSDLYRDLVADKNRCVAFANFNVVKEKSEISIDSDFSTYKTISLSKEEALIAFQKRRIRFIIAAMLINRDFVLEEKIFFDEECRYSEDVVYIWKVLCKADCVSYNNAPLYSYILHPGSTMTSSNLDKILTCQGAIQRLYSDYISKVEGMHKFKRTFISTYYLAIARSASRLLDFESFRQLGKTLEFNKYFVIDPRGRSFKAEVLIWLYKLNYRLFYEIIKK